MTILEELLIKKGFVENVDFTLEADVLTALEQTRDVEQVIHHPEEQKEILDENGQSYDPKQYETIPAWDEVIIVQETFVKELPSVSELKAECVKRADVALLLNDFLADKAHLRTDDDSINIVDGVIHRWDFKNIACPSIDELYGLIQPVQSKLKQDKINQECLQYLNKTDWMIIRASENPAKPVPEEILIKRQLCRDSIK
jgi:hypothetical protein